MISFAFFLFVLWLIGVLTANLLGGVVHALLVLAVILFIVRLIRGGKSQQTPEQRNG